MNRLLSGEKREVIIHQIIEDGIYRQRIAAKALSNYILTEKDEAVIDYYDTMESNADALEDAYQEALLCTNPNMIRVSHFLDAYLRITVLLLDDISVCRLSDEELTALTAEAGQSLRNAQEFCRRCLSDLQIPI